MLDGIGGLGIITIGIAVFPMFKILSLNNLLYSEYSGTIKKRLPNIRSVVIHITVIYYSLILLCISFGGFANYSDSIGHYNNPMLEVITIIFMILSSLPFLSYLKIIRRLDICHDEQVSCFIRIVIHIDWSFVSVLVFFSLLLVGVVDLQAVV